MAVEHKGGLLIEALLRDLPYWLAYKEKVTCQIRWLPAHVPLTTSSRILLLTLERQSLQARVVSRTILARGRRLIWLPRQIRDHHFQDVAKLEVTASPDDF